MIVSNSVAWALLPGSLVDEAGVRALRALQEFRDQTQKPWELISPRGFSSSNCEIKQLVVDGLSHIEERRRKDGKKSLPSFPLRIVAPDERNDWIIWISCSTSPSMRLAIVNTPAPGHLAHPSSELIEQLIDRGAFDFGRIQDGSLWIGEACRFYVMRKLNMLHGVHSGSAPVADPPYVGLIDCIHELFNVAGRDRLDLLPQTAISSWVSEMDQLVQSSVSRQEIERHLTPLGISYRQFFPGAILRRLGRMLIRSS